MAVIWGKNIFCRVLLACKWEDSPKLMIPKEFRLKCV